MLCIGRNRLRGLSGVDTQMCSLCSGQPLEPIASNGHVLAIAFAFGAMRGKPVIKLVRGNERGCDDCINAWRVGRAEDLTAPGITDYKSVKFAGGGYRGGHAGERADTHDGNAKSKPNPTGKSNPHPQACEVARTRTYGDFAQVQPRASGSPQCKVDVLK
jgi:hypothetical protein